MTSSSNGQYSSDSIDKIVQTIRGLQNKTSKVVKKC